jgi:uncharacterized Zn-binding protein involved in type VI secretion
VLEDTLRTDKYTDKHTETRCATTTVVDPRLWRRLEAQRALYARQEQRRYGARGRQLAIVGVLLMLALIVGRIVTSVSNIGVAHAAAAKTSANMSAMSASPVSGALVVRGNQLTVNGQPVVLHGVNRSGTEYACIQGWGIFDGPSDAASVAAMASWGVTLVRVPLNEDCWLGINGVPAAYAGATYQSAIEQYVALLHQYGIRAELSLMWGAPGTYQATYQSGSPDADHSPALWSSLASAFTSDTEDILAPWGETVVDWTCFLNGGTCEATYGPKNTPYTTAGMQQAVTLMRGAGYSGVIAIPCIDYANDCDDDSSYFGGQGGGTWLTHEPADPLHQLVAEAHVYGKNACDTAACLTATMAPIAAAVPLLFAETGETYDGSECGSSYEQAILGWADAHGVSWAAWTWDTWGNCSTLALISAYDGTVNAGTYPQYIHDHLLSYLTTGVAGGTPTPTPSPPPSPSPSPSPSPGGCTQGVAFASLVASPNPTYQGLSTKFIATFTAACPYGGAFVSFSLTNSSGTVLWTHNVSNVTLTGASQSSSYTWSVPQSAPTGAYTISAQVLDANGNALPVSGGPTSAALTISASRALSNTPCVIVVNGQLVTGHCTGMMTP